MFRRIHEDQVVSAILAVITLAYWNSARSLETLMSDDAVGPAGFPTLISVVSLILCALLFLRPQRDQTFAKLSLEAVGYWLVMLGYALAVPFAGFMLSTAIFIAVLLSIFRVRIVWAMTAAVVITAVLHILFNMRLGLELSVGPWANDMIDQILYGFSVAFEPYHLFILVVGALAGTLVGILPGLGPVGTLAILLPVSYGMDATSLIILMSAIYYGAMYGGSTTAILLNIPGESASVVTMIDGNQMAKQGRAGPALAISAIGSFVAGTGGVVMLMLFAPTITSWALKFGPAEYFGLLVFGLSTVVALTGRSLVKGLLSLMLGLGLGTIGLDPVTGYARISGDNLWLADGIDFSVVAMGLFAVSEILETSLIAHQTERRIPLKSVWISFADLKLSALSVLRGSFIGFFVGVLPGAGSTVASFLAYNIEKKVVRDSSKFGFGDIRGVASPESANNAASSGSLVPLMTLGVPGSAATALMLGALLIGGVTPGPDMIVKHADIFWGLVASMYLGNVMLLIVNYPLIPLWVRILDVPAYFIIPIIVVISTIGVYSLKYSPVDLAMLMGFGVVGYYMRNRDYPLAPVVLGLVLGDRIEQSMRQALIISDNDPMIFFRQPICAAFLLLAVASLFLPIVFSTLRGVLKMKESMPD